MQRYLHHVQAHAYIKILSPLRQHVDGKQGPKHVAIHYIVIKYTTCNTIVFDCLPFSQLDCQNVTAVTHSARSNQPNREHSETPHRCASNCVNRTNAKVAIVNCKKSNVRSSYSFPPSLTSALEGWEWSTAGPDQYTSWKLPQYRLVGLRGSCTILNNRNAPVQSVFKPQIIRPAA